MADDPDIIIKTVDESFVQLEFSSQGITRELSDTLTFEIQNARYHPAVRRRQWDGKIRLYNARNGTIYSGLVPHIHEFAKQRNYLVEDRTHFNLAKEFSLTEAEQFIKDLNLPFKPKDYQLRAFTIAARRGRAVLLSPTASGKSLIAYMIARWHNHHKRRVLVIVPTTSLVMQMCKDFQDYGYKKPILGIMAGVDKTPTGEIVAATWQSVYNMPAEYFNNFDVIIGDEAHNFKAKSLVTLMTKARNIEYRIGMSGTLDDAEVNELVITGLFGKVTQIVKTKELMDRKDVADVSIKVLVLKHPEAAAKDLYGKEYNDEITYLISNEKRNKFITNLAASLKGNTLILYSRVEQHGQILFDNLNKLCNNENVYFVHGGVDAEDRENIRAIVEQSDNAKIVASYGTFSTGINIKRLHNIILAFGSKSRVRVLQSLGRGLRLGEDKHVLKLYDIADDLKYRKNNYTLNHMIARIKMYVKEGFNYAIYNINLTG